MSIASSAKGASYKELISFLADHCDTLGFALPCFEKNTIIDSEYQVQYIDENGQTDFENYIHQIKPMLKILEKYQISRTEDFFTKGTISGHTFMNYRVKLSSEVKKLLLSKDCLTDWDYPDAPSDLSFYRGGHCCFYCIAHEDMAFIETEDKEERQFMCDILEKRGRDDADS